MNNDTHPTEARVPVILVKLPRIFWEDHRDRDLPSGRLIKEFKHQVMVNLNREDYEELLSDARHYSSDAMGTWEGDYAKSVKRSAKRTVRTLEKFKPHDFVTYDN